MDEKKWLRIALIALAAALAAYAALRFVLPVALPFLIGALVAALCDPAVRFFRGRTGLPRWVCAGLSVGLFYVLLGGALFLLLRRAGIELAGLCRQLPEILSSLAGPAARLHEALLRLASRAPDGLGTALRAYVERLFSGSAGWVDTLNAKVFSAASDFLAGLPGAALFAVTSVLSSFMASSELPAVRRALTRPIPAQHRDKVTLIAARLRRAFGAWCLAQLELMGVTFAIVTAGLFFLGVDFALLFGLFIALIDALPVFGTGTVLLPWSLVLFARGQAKCALGMLAVYGAAMLTRTALEPKLVGRQIGLPPLVTLLAIYAGYRTVGLAGMILFPIAALLGKQLWELWSRSARD